MDAATTTTHLAGTDWGVVAATVVGPIAAVLITLWYQDRDRTYQRKLSVFATMMRWRRHIVSVDFVGALNLVPVEFSSHPDVVRKYKDLFSIFEDSGWEVPESRPRLNQNVETKTTELLSEMGNAIGIKIDQMQILKGAYAPQGWHDDEQVNRFFRDQAARLLRGEIALPVIVYEPRPPVQPGVPTTRSGI